MLTDVEKSLASVSQSLCMFNRLSYYKVNKSKSYILGLNVPLHTRRKIEKLYPYTWDNIGIKYLGITLTPTRVI